MTSILILGSTGFIGKNLKNLFEEHDSYKVYARKSIRDLIY